MSGNGFVSDQACAEGRLRLRPFRFLAEGVVIFGAVALGPDVVRWAIEFFGRVLFRAGALFPTLELIFLSPLLLVGLGIYLHRRCCHSPLHPAHLLVYLITSLGAMLLPLRVGVWIPDFTGLPHTLGKVTATSGHEISVVQRWNYRDFYTTSAMVRAPDGSIDQRLIDGDGPKRWSMEIRLNDSQSATVFLDGGFPMVVRW